MRSNTISTAILIVATIAPLMLFAAASAQDEWIGQQFMPREDAAYKIRDSVVAAEEITLPLVPTAERGKWLWIGTAWVRKVNVIAMDEAEAYYSDLIAKNSGKLWAHYHLAATAHGQGNIDTALEGYAKVIELDPQYASAFISRGNIYIEQGDVDRAISDFTTALRLKPESSEAFNLRGVAYGVKNNFDRALQDFGNAVRLNPSNTVALNNRGWLLATCPDDQFRSGKQAVTDAMKACELTKFGRAEFLDTLAAAAAETGDFKAAINWIEKALALVPSDSKYHELFSARLTLYRKNQPYRVAR